MVMEGSYRGGWMGGWVLWDKVVPADAASSAGVEAVVPQLVVVDLHAQARAGPDEELAVIDTQGLGEQVVAHVEEVGELARVEGGAPVRGAEGDGTDRAELAVDLVAHHDLEPEPLAQMEHPLRGREAGACRLDRDRGRRPAKHLAGDLGGGRRRLVRDERDVD